jgi:signal transduction histidine kinase
MWTMTYPRSAKARWFGLPRRVAAGFVLAVVSLAATATASMLAMSARTGAGRAIAQANGERLVLNEIESALLVSDTSLDAYVDGGSRRHRTRHLRARGRLKPSIDQLVASSDDPMGRTVVDRLLPQLRDVLDEQDRVLALVDAGDRDGARALRRRVGTGPALEQAYDMLEALDRHEEQEVARLQYASQRTHFVSNVVFHGAQVVLLVLVLIAVRIVRDEIRAREEREAERAHALEVQQRLVAVVSHDLRNPLSGILTAAWALARSDLPEDARRVIRRIASAGRRMERLIRDLLDWSRANAGAEIPVDVREADLFDVCVRVAEDLGAARSARVELVHDGDTRAAFDPDRMEQVVANLLSNALKYGAPDRPVRLGAVGEDEVVRLEVRDEGPGIDPAIRAELFEPFRRAPRGAPGANGSVGLGLFVVHMLARAQGADVHVRSAPGEGTTFVVRVPRALPAPPGAAA